jgi:hypothetical protein
MKQTDLQRLNSWRYALLAAIFLLGSVLLFVYPPSPLSFYSVAQRLRPNALPAFVGIFLISIAATHLIVSSSLGIMRRLLKLEEEVPENLLAPALVGICESIMFPTALLMGYGEFIGVWLAVKVAGQWARWGGQVPHDDPRSANEGRRRFSRFLVGNALSIICSAATYGALSLWALRPLM